MKKDVITTWAFSRGNIKMATKIDKNYFNYERIGRDMWGDLVDKTQDLYNIYWDSENDEAITQKNISIETPEDVWGPEKQFGKKASFRCELRFAGGDWEQGVFYFCCQCIKGGAFRTDECFVLVPSKEQGNLGLIKDGKDKWHSSQGDGKDVEYSHEEAEKQCWESLPEMLRKANSDKIEEYKKMSMCLPIKFASINEAIQHLADFTGSRVIIAGVADQLLKKHQKNHSLDIKDLKNLLELTKKEISKGVTYNNSKVDIHKKQADQIAKLSIDLSLSDSKNISGGDIKENSSFFGSVKKTINMISVLLYLRQRYPRYNDEEMKKWYNKDINTFKNIADLKRHFNIHKDLLTKDDNDFVSLRPIVKSDGKANKKIADLPTEEVIAGYIIKRFDNKNQIPTQEWIDLECEEQYCITTKNYFGEYGGPPYFWVLKQKGDKFIQKGMIIPNYFDHDLSQALRNDKNADVMNKSLIKELMPFLEKHNILEKAPSMIYYIDNPSEEVQLKAVKKEGYTIKFIKNPSEAVQLEAVKEDEGAIEHIKNPSEAIQLEATKRNGSILMYLKNPSEAVKLEAVKNYGYAITYIDNPTEEICLAAVKQNGYALQYVKEQTGEICLAAVKQDGFALQYVKEQTEEICLAAVKQDGYALRFVKEQTEEICLAAVKQEGYALRYVKEQTEEICLAAVKQDGNALQYIKEQTEEICLAAVKQNVLAIEYVNEDCLPKTEEMTMEEVCKELGRDIKIIKK